MISGIYYYTNVLKKMRRPNTHNGYGFHFERGFVPLLTQMGAVYKEKKEITPVHTELESFTNEGQEDPVQLLHPFCGCGC